MNFGWAGNILYINLSTREVRLISTLPYIRKYIGGRMLAARLAWEYIPKKAGPLDEDNIIIISSGPLSGTIAPTSGRTVMSMISPVPYPFPWYTHSTLGGWFATQMKASGYDAIMIQGKAENKEYIEIKDNSVQIKSAEYLWGKDTVRTQEILKKRMGSEAQVLAIGPAGENQVLSATVQHDFDCSAAHSGFGAVWGSKNLKALSILGTGDIIVAHPNKLINEMNNLKKFSLTPQHAFLRYDQKQSINHVDGMESRPVCTQSCVNNCHVGKYLKTSDNRLIETFCIGKNFLGVLPSAYNKPGTDIEIPVLTGYSDESSTRMLELCNLLGIDYWLRITLQSWLTALKKEGYNEIMGYPISPENSEWFISFISDIAYQKGLGKLFTRGLARTLEILEDVLPEKMVRLGHEIVFAFGFQAHREGRFWDNEPLPYWIFSAMMYISETRDPAIGSHSLLLLAELQIAHKELASKKFRKLAEKVWNDPGALEPNYNFRQKSKVAVWGQRMHFLNDSLPMCDFSFPRLTKAYSNVSEWIEDEDIYGDLDIDCRMLNAVTGISFSREDLDMAADRAFFIERCMLARAGRYRKHEEALASHFELPCRDDSTFVTNEDFLKMMDAYYDQRGWNKEDGWPENEQLIELGLEDVALELESIRQARLIQ